ncbi:hypothetical protein KI811_15135 [Geobacter hydrogenophilus]|uniref:Uncharacterized protein n=1 Tax=Geobacter hydrogenophilus TaxID=40983 RepID=A0A9W6FY36_9BACT|nr:hypothetical protein [Geobacter hydrogenophilus]MBT0895144.1 hypothetical protein [Geobacter hydrogenophilus]GLI36970.1 hypothetical protein GHYDROH2_04710 [Geobacter hydrogenophilus]
MLSPKAREELKKAAASTELRDDMAAAAALRQPPWMRDGIVDADRWLDYLTEYNKFINHRRKPETSFIETRMLL